MDTSFAKYIRKFFTLCVDIFHIMKYEFLKHPHDNYEIGLLRLSISKLCYILTERPRLSRPDWSDIVRQCFSTYKTVGIVNIGFKQSIVSDIFIHLKYAFHDARNRQTGELSCK